MHSLVAFSITGTIEMFLETFSRFIVHIRIEVNTADEDNLVRYECYICTRCNEQGKIREWMHKYS